jgi:hypothetical protein
MDPTFDCQQIQNIRGFCLESRTPFIRLLILSFFPSFVNFKQFKYFKDRLPGYHKNKTGSILGTLAEIPLMWGSQTFFQERNVASVIRDARR